MNMRGKLFGGLCIIILMAGSIQAQTDHYIENQRYVVGLKDFSWGNTYVGEITSGNGLELAEIIKDGNTNAVKLTVSSLLIGSPSNSNNEVDIFKGGELQVNGPFSILGPTNGNRLRIHDEGTLFVNSDFDATMEGFFYTQGANLKVGGEVSNLDDIEGSLNFFLTGENATWNFGTNLLTIGGATSNNSVTVSDRASLEIDNLTIGAAGTISNSLVVADSGRLFVKDNINLLGTSNYLMITNSGILAVDFDFDASVGVQIEKGGVLEAHRNLTLNAITNGGGVIMNGPNATWTNLSVSTLAIGGTTDENFLDITTGATVRVGNFELGSISNKNNEIRITDGGNLILTGAGSTVNETNELWVTDGGKLTLLSDYSITGGIHWHSGGILEAFGRAPVLMVSLSPDEEYVEAGGLFLNYGKILILNGSNALWAASSENLHVGDFTPDNALIITNGGIANVNSASIGDFKKGNNNYSGGHNNSITITGTNSLLNSSTYVAIGGTMDSGNWYEGGNGNTITVENGGRLLVGTTLHNRNTTGTSGLNIGPGGVVDAVSYHQSKGAYLNFYTDASGTNAGLLRVSGTAAFDAKARVGFDAVAALDIGQVYTNRIVETGTLIVGGVTNATTSDLDALEQTGGSLVNYDLWEQGQDIYATYSRRSISEGGGFAPDSMLDKIGDEIDRLATLNAAASNQFEILDNLGSDKERKLQMEQLYAYEIPSFMHNQGILGGIDQVRARGSVFHNTRGSGSLPRPKGVAGPHAADQGLQGWVKAYGGYGNRDNDSGTSFTDGYDVQSYGTVIGFDRAFGEWLLGLAGGYAGTVLDGDNGDESDGTTGYGLVYASYGTKDWYGDLVLSYGVTDMDNTSGTDFGVKSSVDASQTAFYIGGGKEYKDPDGSDALLHPLLGLRVSLYDQDAYTEKSTTAVAKDVEAYERWSYQSILGASMLIPKTGETVDHETEFRAYWLHEFNEDEEIVDYTLVGSSQRGQFTLRSPDQDVAQLGIGYLASWRNGLKLRADLDGQISKTFYSATLSAALLYEF